MEIFPAGAVIVDGQLVAPGGGGGGGVPAPHAATHEAAGTDAVSHDLLFGAGVNTHAQIDSHISDTSNPHATTAAQVGADPAGTAAAAVGGHEGAYDHANLPTADEKDALVGTDGSPGAANPYVTDSDARNSDARVPLAHAASHSTGQPDAIDHTNIGSIGTNTHAQIDSHIASTLNPHSVTKTQVGLGNVTNDAQLKRSDNDWASFTPDAAPGGTDVLLIEKDTTGAKRIVLIGDLPYPPRPVSIAFRADGFFRIASGIDITEPQESFTISRVVFRREIAGSAGTTEIDLLLNGTTIFTTVANRPKIQALLGDGARVTAVPDITAVSGGDRLEMEIIGVEDGDPQDAVAFIEVS